MVNHEDPFHEFGSKLRFPRYFGKNWPALKDCLDGTTWIERTGRYLIVIRDWSAVLSESEGDRTVLERILNDVGEGRSRLGHGPGSGLDTVAFNAILAL